MLPFAQVPGGLANLDRSLMIARSLGDGTYSGATGTATQLGSRAGRLGTLGLGGVAIVVLPVGRGRRRGGDAVAQTGSMADTLDGGNGTDTCNGGAPPPPIGGESDVCSAACETATSCDF